MKHNLLTKCVRAPWALQTILGHRTFHLMPSQFISSRILFPYLEFVHLISSHLISCVLSSSQLISTLLITSNLMFSQLPALLSNRLTFPPLIPSHLFIPALLSSSFSSPLFSAPALLIFSHVRKPHLISDKLISSHLSSPQLLSSSHTSPTLSSSHLISRAWSLLQSHKNTGLKPLARPFQYSMRFESSKLQETIVL